MLVDGAQRLRPAGGLRNDRIPFRRGSFQQELQHPNIERGHVAGDHEMRAFPQRRQAGQNAADGTHAGQQISHDTSERAIVLLRHIRDHDDLGDQRAHCGNNLCDERSPVYFQERLVLPHAGAFPARQYDSSRCAHHRK